MSYFMSGVCHVINATRAYAGKIGGAWRQCMYLLQVPNECAPQQLVPRQVTCAASSIALARQSSLMIPRIGIDRACPGTGASILQSTDTVSRASEK